MSPCCTLDYVSLKFIGVAGTKARVALQFRSDTAAQGSWELITISFKDCFYYTLEPICQSVEVIMTKGLLIELNEHSKQIKMMKHFMLPNRQAAVPPESHSAGQPGWGVGGKRRVCLEIAQCSTNTPFQQLARGCSEHSKTPDSSLLPGIQLWIRFSRARGLFLPLVFEIASLLIFMARSF